MKTAQDRNILIFSYCKFKIYPASCRQDCVGRGFDVARSVVWSRHRKGTKKIYIRAGNAVLRGSQLGVLKASKKGRWLSQLIHQLSPKEHLSTPPPLSTKVSWALLSEVAAVISERIGLTCHKISLKRLRAITNSNRFLVQH